MNSLPSIISLETARAEASPWPVPVAVGRIDPPSLALAEAIPSTIAPFRDFILATADAVQIAPDAVAPLAMALVSLAASRAFEVQLLPQWRETAPLWILILAEPGERKSALLSGLTGPLHSWQADERALLKCDLAKYAEARRIDEARLAGIRSKIAKAKQGDVSTLKREAEDLAARLENMPSLATPDLVTTDATPEAVRELLARNGEKLGLISAETDAGQLMGSRYAKSGGANVDLFLAAFTGDPCPAHRVGRDLPLAHPSLAMALAVQPAAVGDVLRDPIARGRGLVDRMALVQPSSCMGSRSLTPPPVPERLAQWWGETLRRILNCPWPGRVILDGESPVRCEQPARVLTLEPAAHDVFCSLRSGLEPKLKEGGDLRQISGFASKLPGVVARLALAFQLMEDTNALTIRTHAMQAACAWSPFLLGHFRAVMGDAGERPTRRQARRLVDALRRRGDRETTARDCFRLIDGADVQSMEDCEPVLAELIAMHYLRPLPEPEKSKGRPGSPRFEVNPAVFTST